MEVQNRTESSLKNSITSVISNVISIITGFIAQAIFIKILGTEFLGLNGLFTNVLTMLSLFELGIGNAIVYNMYKPIAEKDTNKIKSLLAFYRKSYKIIALVIFIIGLIILPFIPLIVGENTLDINIYLVYLLFLISTISSYFMIYKRNMLFACQQNYIINVIHSVYFIVLNLTQLLILYLTKNYYLYLVIKIACQLIENLVINIICNKKYPFIKEKNVEKLDKETEKSIYAKVKALIFHKVGNIFVNGTDNIIISKFFGVFTVGLYYNYSAVIKAVTTLFSQLVSSTMASIGNLIVVSDHKKLFQTFKRLRFINFWIATFTATSILVIMQPFIEIWVGKSNLLDINVLVILTINYFQSMQRISYNSFKDSAGIWEEDKYVPLIESALNIAFSIILLKIFGLAGVFMGTIISSFILWFYSYPKFVYKKLFKRNYKQYFQETFGYVLLFLIITFSTFFISNKIIISNVFLKFVISCLIGLTIPNILLIIIFRKNDNFEYLIGLVKKILNKVFKRRKHV